MSESMNVNESQAQSRLKVAVIGAGPAGVYASDILLRQLAEQGEELGLGTDARIDIFEKLPVPFGLVRYGVAPDHPSIKYIAGALEKTLSNPDLHLYADVEFGKDISLEELEERYDVVLFATGATDDRPLEIEGHGLDGVYGAAHFVEWYDGYPTAPLQWPLEARQVAVIGGGNVAMDVARLLMRQANDLLPTDVPDNVYEGIAANPARELHMFIRRGPAQAKFAVQELRELEKLPGVQIIIDQADFELDEATIAQANEDKLTRQMLAELYTIRDMAEQMEAQGGTDFEGNPADRKYYIHFYQMPSAILGTDGKVSGIRVEHTRVDASGRMSETGEYSEYPVQAVYHAIGYKPAEVSNIPYDFGAYTLANDHGRICSAPASQGGEPLPRLYATGWAKRGPVGLIGSTKSDALETVSNMLSDLAASNAHGRLAPDRAEDSTDRLLEAKGVRPIDFAGWLRVDAYERAEGAKAGREHIKVVDPDQLRRLSHS
ncbi:glutamate synthase [Bombiscardovia apis]|uniref:ferredoxin--NADP(+) reductase n=1 Tax=Bombiscardovia apis TaxID=2932182 RepID=A0ABM8BAV0_9BIFI|nr:FAD-dependent oxidoreductase [Bombiscardovia apis]BDR53968.1 glutamate synthase [Bombiscardovia apis]